jgi:hypothetical protein
MARNRAVTFMGRGKMEVCYVGYPKLTDPQGRKSRMLSSSSS